MSAPAEDVYCTLLTSDGYLPGAQVLAHSLRDAGTKKKLAVLVTLDGLGASTVAELEKVYDYIIPVERVVNRFPANLHLMNRGDLSSTFTKIHLWQQLRFRKIVYIDADVVALRAPDELFDLDVSFAAAPDVGWPDCFNSGVLVIRPNMGDFYSLSALAQRGISFDGADQGLLNMHFVNYHRLSFRYNCTPSGHYQYVPAYRHFQSGISMLHFIGKDKPWILGREVTKSGSIHEEMLGRWWAVHDRHLRAPVPVQAPPSAQPVTRPKMETSQASLEEPAVEAHSSEHSAQVSIILSERKQPELIAPSKEEPFSAPFSEWDPIKSAPPAQSRPEAAHFPQQTYEMSQDPTFFQAPPAYPAPPENLGYELPKLSAPALDAPLKPIFPWELNAPEPTRVFPDSRPPSPPKAAPSAAAGDEPSADQVAPPTPPTQIKSPDPWKNFGATTNAWDEMPEIEDFIAQITSRRASRAQTIQEDAEVEGAIRTRVRRPSIRLTDFPSEIERPSLPVTPTPVRRPLFWATERDEEGELPAAEGVPRQADWDPSAKLEELSRHQTEVLPRILHTDQDARSQPVVPRRELPESSLSSLASPTKENEAAAEAKSSSAPKDTDVDEREPEDQSETVEPSGRNPQRPQQQQQSEDLELAEPNLQTEPKNAEHSESQSSSQIDPTGLAESTSTAQPAERPDSQEQAAFELPMDPHLQPQGNRTAQIV